MNMTDARLRIMLRNYEQAPSLGLADSIITEYRRITGLPALGTSEEFRVASTVPEQRVRDLLTSALEGGTGYWAFIWDQEFAPGLEYADFREGGKMQIPNNYHHPFELIPFVPGCALLIVDSNEVSSNNEGGEADLPEGTEIWRLDRQSIQDGLQVMATNYPRHWSNFIEQNDDAETGDVFLQCCLMGKIVYC
jgi:hypothetical protein